MSRFVYPRLPLAFAHQRIEELREALRSGGLEAVAGLAGSEHPRAAPVATGGRVADPDHIADVRDAVIRAIAIWAKRGQVPRQQAAAFDLVLGRTLHERLGIVSADAAHSGTWSFLTLVALPDVALLRFPDMHVDRLVGGQRNVLRRTWIRQEVLGDLLHVSDRPLGEDELVGLFERTALARNRPLIRRLAAAVLAYDGPTGRSDWARELYKRVTFSTGPRLLDALSDQELDDLISGKEAPPTSTPVTGAGAPVTPHPPIEWAEGAHYGATAVRAFTDRGPREIPTGSRATSEVPRRPSRPPVSELEMQFQRAMLRLYERTRRELGYNARHLLAMIADSGGVATARRLVQADRPSEGFSYLWEHQRLDLAVEALVAEPQYSSLFDAEVVALAHRRLRDHGFST